MIDHPISRDRAFSAAAVLIVTAFTAFRPPMTDAGSSALTFAPAKPARGAVLDVTYQPTSVLANQSTLLLRARMRTEHDEQYNSRLHQIVVVELNRRPDGTFRGRFALPPKVVYAAFAVESRDGEQVDSNHRRLWELLTHDVDGRPTADALVQKSNDMMGRDWVRAYSAAESAARLAPDTPAHWVRLLFFQKQVLRGSALEAVLPSHRARLAKFDAEYGGRTSIPGEILGEMMWYAVSLEDSLLTEKWRQRLLSEAPLHTQALQERMIPLLRTRYDQPDTLLAFFESLWHATRGHSEIGAGYSHLYQQGFAAALRSKDTVAIARWSERYLRWSPRDTTWVASQLSRHPHFRPRAIAILRDQVSRRDADDRFRDLYQSKADERRSARGARQDVVSTLAAALLASGDTAAALANYEAAAALYWNPEVFRTYASLQLVRGDTARARQMLANASVDPAMPPAFADTARAMTNADSATWARERADAMQRMRASVLESAVRVLVTRDVEVADVQGRKTRLAALTGGRPAVLVYWARNCGFALQAAPRIQALAQQLRAAGTPVIIVADEKPSPELTAAMRAAGLAAPLYADVSGDVAAGFNVFGTPTYFVLDGAGSIRFAYTSLAEIPRQVAALSHAE